MYQKFINLVLVLAKTHYNCYFDKGVRVTKKKKSLKGAQGFVRKVNHSHLDKNLEKKKP